MTPVGAKSAIEWTESTWNPVTGCTKVSPGCKNCYAERMARRLQAMGQQNYVSGFSLAVHEHALELPLQWKTPQVVFVNSMSDLFHKDVPLAFIEKVFDVMNRADWHQYQILTKRSARLLELDRYLRWADHIWMGVSVENEDYAFRIDDLRRTGARTKFLSLEPLLGPLPSLDLSDIDWVIVGGESGPGPGGADELLALGGEAVRPRDRLFQDPAAHRPHPALGIGNPHPGQKGDQASGNAVGKNPLRGHAAQILESIAVNQVRAGVQSFQKPRYELRRVLAVGVQGHDGVAALGQGVVEAVSQGVALAVVGRGEVQHQGPGASGRFRRVVGRGVVHHQHIGQVFEDAGYYRGYSRRLVVGGN